MKIAILQLSVTDSVSENIQALEAAFQTLPPVDVVLLPELWNVPYLNPLIEKAASRGETIRSLLARLARDHHCLLCGGTIPYEQDGHIYNRCFVFGPQGEIGRYDKTHLLEVHTGKHTYTEAEVFTPGSHFFWFDSDWGRIGICVCFDLRFPEVCRRLAKEGCFLILAPAAFNKAVGEKHWKPLLETRAMENEIFLAASAPSYSYGGYTSYGHSMVVSPDGIPLGELGTEPGTLIVDIDPDEVEQIRRRSPFWKIRRTDLYD